MKESIPWIISALSLLLAYLTFTRNGSKDEKQAQAAENVKFDGLKESLLKANMKLDQVCATTNETRSDIKTLNKDIQQISERVTICERDLKSAFKRIDELKGEKNDD